METIDFSDFYSGGYFLLRSGRPDWPSPFGAFLPEGNLISLSKCICSKRLSIVWRWTPGDKQAALEFGIRENQWDEFVSWIGSEYREQMDLLSMFYTPNAAREFIRRFELNTDNLFIIGAGLPKEAHEAWVKEEADNEGIAKRIKQAVRLDEAGTPLGYDIVSYSYTDFSHSWLCSYLDNEMYELFGIRSNDLGLIDHYADAKKVNEWIAEDDGKGMRAEPEPYDVWLATSYSLDIE